MLEIIQKYGVMFLVGAWPHGPVGGLAATLILAASGLVLAFPLAVLLGFARISDYKALRWFAAAWVVVLRGVPLIMLIFWAYFLVPLVTGMTVSVFTTALVAIVLYESAFLAEIVRAGLQGLPRGQTEAARSVGLSYWQSMRYVILPQALVNMIPSLVNQFVSTVKATSIVYIIGMEELTFVANQVNSVELTSALQTYMVLAGIYFLVCLTLSYAARMVEVHINRRRAGLVQG
ncbi:amino acid ABC transporter permease [Bordetella genomosp. 10]|uniref:Amino acid ABC transporter permease n=1 Tax=Bordetella genomosp. 10 TaxID=1416804 RepID=A0A261SKX0_9BORD|nr:amino acid ABC transporter permease [Bordetella genomosp. 10]OZI38078.1 amino acid ABC transporter permease [Bordetella genomosp. 10]